MAILSNVYKMYPPVGLGKIQVRLLDSAPLNYLFVGLGNVKFDV